MSEKGDAPNAAQDERAVRALVAQWMAARIAGDTRAVLDLIDDDALFIVAGRAPFDKAAFAQMAQAQRGGAMDGTSDVEEVRIAGDWAVLRNHVRMSMTTPDGATRRFEGRTLTILRRNADARWRLWRDANLVASLA